MKSTDPIRKVTLNHNGSANLEYKAPRYKAPKPKRYVTTKAAKETYALANSLMLAHRIDGWWVYSDGWVVEVNGWRTPAMSLDKATEMLTGIKRGRTYLVRVAA